MNETKEAPDKGKYIHIDENLYASLAELVAASSHNSDVLELKLRGVARIMTRTSLFRRLFGILFPTVEAGRRVR